MSTFDVNRLRSLDVGNVLEMGRPFEAVGKEPLCFRVEGVRKTPDGRSIVTFSVWYFSVWLGTWVAGEQSDGRISWMDLEKAKKKERRGNEGNAGSAS